MPRNRKLFGVASLAACWLPAAAMAQGAPPAGVYSCYEARMAPNAPGCIRSNIGCFGLVITPTPVAMFGLIDGSTYANYDGGRGHYRYDAGTGVLEMTDGPRQGWHYRKKAEWSFTLIGNEDGQEHFTCPLETAKDPNKGPW